MCWLTYQSIFWDHITRCVDSNIINPSWEHILAVLLTHILTIPLWGSYYQMSWLTCQSLIGTHITRCVDLMIRISVCIKSISYKPQSAIVQWYHSGLEEGGRSCSGITVVATVQLLWCLVKAGANCIFLSKCGLKLPLIDYLFCPTDEGMVSSDWERHCSLETHD